MFVFHVAVVIQHNLSALSQSPYSLNAFLIQRVLCGKYPCFWIELFGSSPGWGHCVLFLSKTLTPMVSLSTRVYKWVGV